MEFPIFRGAGNGGKSIFSSPERFIEAMTGESPESVRIWYRAAPEDLREELRPLLPQLLDTAVN